MSAKSHKHTSLRTAPDLLKGYHQNELDKDADGFDLEYDYESDDDNGLHPPRARRGREVKLDLSGTKQAMAQYKSGKFDYIDMYANGEGQDGMPESETDKIKTKQSGRSKSPFRNHSHNRSPNPSQSNSPAPDSALNTPDDVKDDKAIVLTMEVASVVDIPLPQHLRATSAKSILKTGCLDGINYYICVLA